MGGRAENSACRKAARRGGVPRTHPTQEVSGSLPGFSVCSQAYLHFSFAVVWP